MSETQLRPHQKDALKRLGNGKILWGPVGTGKSRVALAYYLRDSAPAPIVVITTAKVRDSLHWEGEAAKFGIGKAQNATLAGVLTVDSWNNIDKYSENKNCFFVFDEQRLIGSGAWVKAFLKIAYKNRWIMLTATPGDTWLDYIPVFIANGFYKNRTEFKREHVIYKPFSKFPKVDRYVGINKLSRLRNSILIKLTYDMHTVRHTEIVKVDYDKELLKRITRDRWNPFEDRPLRDVAELFRLMRMVVNSHESRLEAVRELLRHHDRLIVFYTWDYELEILRRLGDENVLAEWNGHKHEEIPKTSKWVYLVQYAAGAEGWNCTETDAMCFYSLTYSYKLWEQAHGRIDRLDTDFIDLWYFVLFSGAPIDRWIWANLRLKKDFQITSLSNSYNF